MKPQVINCGNGCKVCDGYGIMTLFPMGWIAPCVACSPHKHLADLEAAKAEALAAFEKAEELRRIDEHNRRVEWSAMESP